MTFEDDIANTLNDWYKAALATTTHKCDKQSWCPHWDYCTPATQKAFQRKEQADLRLLALIKRIREHKTKGRKRG